MKMTRPMNISDYMVNKTKYTLAKVRRFLMRKFISNTCTF